MERRWEEALAKLEETKQQYQQRKQAEALVLTPEQKARIQQLAHDLPGLWKAPSTRAKDRKRILRLLLKDITVQKLADPKQIVLHLRWQGGATEDIPLTLPPRS